MLLSVDPRGVQLSMWVPVVTKQAEVLRPPGRGAGRTVAGDQGNERGKQGRQGGIAGELAARPALGHDRVKEAAGGDFGSRENCDFGGRHSSSGRWAEITVLDLRRSWNH